MLPGGGAISDNPKIIASFTLHISINFFDLKRLIGSYLIIFKSLSGCYFSSLHCTALEIAEWYLFFVWEKKCAFPQQAAAPPCKETPGVYIAWERLRPKIGPVSDNLQHDAATFPFSTVQHCFLGEFRVKLGGIFRIFARRQSVSRISIERIDWTQSVSI